MKYCKLCFLVFPFVSLLTLFLSCKDHKPKAIQNDIVKSPARMDERVGDDLQQMLQIAHDSGGHLYDSNYLIYSRLLDTAYEHDQYNPIWSNKGRWLAPADSLFYFIEHGKEYGLFISDYHYEPLSFLYRVLKNDSLYKRNAAFWARADLLMTDALFLLVKHLKQGRLPYDSVTLRKDTVLSDSFYLGSLSAISQNGSVRSTLENLEPRHRGYDSLKAYARKFLETAKFRKLTWIDYPYKDSAVFYSSVTRRLQEVGYIDSTIPPSGIDTATLANAIRKYQEVNKLRVTGKPTGEMVTMMDNSDWEKFKRIAINLDRYKLLPDTLPTTYVWVNLPGFYLNVINADTVVFDSRVIVGAPKTRTPLLTSEISNFITFPQWTVPSSIIFKEMLPKIKANIDFLRKENLMIVDDNDSVRDPYKINWAKLNKNNFPYQIKQRQGDDNSLGVMKFNFRNKYDVYLHDTNVRWMFDKSFRALSHGCVRVKQWQKMADFLVRNDTIRYKPDTLRAWIDRKEKHTVYGFARVPIYIRYFTCEGKKERVVFHEDIYGEDRYLRNTYFANKPIY